MQSGTGVYYQAMPAVGPDGKNVMKLIPVKKVNGQFVGTQLLPSRNVCLPAHESPVPLPQNRVPTLQPTADGRFILKTPLDVNTVFNSVKSQHGEANVLLQSATNQHVSVVTHNMVQNALPSPVQSNNKAVIATNSPHLLNNVKAPAIPSGHYLTIPCNATVRTLPASALPSSIKNRICHSTNDSNPAKGLQMVLYVSPVSSLKLDQQGPCLTNPSEFPQTSVPTSTAIILRSLEKPPKTSQGGAHPMKWVVEERAGSSAPYLIPVTSPNMSSDILKAVMQIDSSMFPNQCPKEPMQDATDFSKKEVTPINGNALVMCNGKVYLVAKKNSQVTKDMMTNAESMLQPRKSAQSPTALGPANTSQKQDPKSSTDNKKPCDIIDLCDDEETSSTCTASERINVPSEPVSENDEDSNVIFVSYIPPKSSESETNKEVTKMNSRTSCVNDAECANLDMGRMKTGGELNRGNDAEVDACESVHATAAALEVSEAWSEKVDVVYGQQTEVTEKKSVPDPTHQPKSDSELRRTFGITFDSSVSLQTIDGSEESQAGHPQGERRLINKRTLEGIHKLIHNSNIERKLKQLIQAQVPTPVKIGKRKRLESNREKNGFVTFSLTDTDSSTLSNSLSDCNDEILSASAEQSRDRVFQTCQAAEEKTSSASGAGKVSGITTDLLCYSSLFEPVQTHTAKYQSGSPDCCSGLHKTLPRSNKGCGRVCTACPSGTKVGGVTGNTASKLQEKPNPPSVNSSNRVPSESNRTVPAVDKVVANSVLSSTTCNRASGKSGNQMTHGSQPQISTNVNNPLATADFSTSQSERRSAVTVTYRSSSRCTQNKTFTSKLETDAQKPDILKVAKNVSSSAQKVSPTSDRIPSDLYSALLDPAEIKRQERIKRLKDLLQEKEAALEKLRKGM